MAETEGKMYQVGSLLVHCPRCGTEITIPISAGVVAKVDDPGKLYIRTDSDVADYWSHSWMHKEGLI
jgi:hypothetical protein